MSIYSGFATRKMQENYNQLLAKLLKLMQDHLIEALSPGKQSPHTLSNKFQQNKVKKYRFLLSKMEQYEEHKYLPPKFSKICHPLKEILGINDQQYIQIQPEEFRSTKSGKKMYTQNSQTRPFEKSNIQEQPIAAGFKTPKTIFYRPKKYQSQFDNTSQIRHRSTTNKSLTTSQANKQKYAQSSQKTKSKLSIHTEQPIMSKLYPKFSQNINTSESKHQMQEIYTDKNDLRKLNESGQIRYKNKKTQLMRKTLQSKKMMKKSEHYQNNDDQVQHKKRGDLMVRVQFRQASPKFNIRDQLRKNIKSTQ